MPNQFDNIEKSVRNAFEDFELPVSEADWKVIQKNIPSSKKRKFAWWINTFTGKKLIFLSVLIVSTITAWVIIGSNSGKSQKNKALASHQLANQSNSNSLNELDTDQSHINQPFATENHLQMSETNTEYSGNQRTISTNDISAVNIDKADIVAIAQNDTYTPNPENTDIKLRPFGIRTILQFMAVKALDRFDWRLKKKLNLKTKMGLYGNIFMGGSPNTVQSNNATGIWEGISITPGNKSSINLRLEAGISMKKGDWTLKAGTAIDGNLPGNSSIDTIRIKIPTQTLPYMDMQGNVLYWLAIRWKDSTILLQNQQKSTWIELPIGIQKDWKAGNKNKISAGITVLPGVRIASAGVVANPYIYQPGSYWQYNYNLNADTQSITTQASDFQHSGRIGAGLQIGYQRDAGKYYWGISANNRYYFTPNWKNGYPLKQNTHNIGIQLNLGIKLQ